MKILITLLILLPSSLFGQGAISLIEMNRLYANYDNKIELALGNYRREIVLVGENLIILPDKEKNHYTVKVTGKIENPKIHMVNKKTGDTIRTYTYSVIRLDLAAVTIGYSFENDTLKTTDSLIHVGYNNPPKVDFSDETYQVISYKLVVLDSRLPEYSVYGNVITLQIRKALQQLTEQDDITRKIYLLVKVKGSDGIIRTRSATYLLK